MSKAVRVIQGNEIETNMIIKVEDSHCKQRKIVFLKPSRYLRLFIQFFISRVTIQHKIGEDWQSNTQQHNGCNIKRYCMLVRFAILA